MGLNDEQREVATTLDGPLFVAAGAGSGKTFTLVRRVLLGLGVPVEGIDNPPDAVADSIENVCAITFTTKAAEELRERIRAALMDAGRLEDALGVDDAWITTIHGMCSRILREHALELGVDPCFEVLNEPQELRRRAVSNVIRQHADDDLVRRIGEVIPLSDMDGSGLSGAIEELLVKAGGLEHGFDSMTLLKPAPEEHVGQLLDCYRTVAKDGSKKNAEDAARYLAYLEEAGVPSSDSEFGELMANIGLLRKPRGDGDMVDVVLLANALTLTLIGDAYLAIHAEELKGVVELARATEQEYRRLKDERSYLDNNDLLTRAYEALRDNPTVRDDMVDRFGLVMVDEFQDTASQQVEIVRMLSGEGERALATVGDAEQSIYRFRGADVDVFRSKCAEVTDALPDHVKQLGTNYRSHHAILDMVDVIFGEGSPIHGDCLHLSACDEATRRGAHRMDDGQRTQLILTCGGNTDTRTSYEAAAVARHLRQLHDEQGFEAGDMVILLSKMTSADVYARAVRAQGLPCVAAGGSSIFPVAPEVKTIQALLSMFANPLDTANGALRVITSEAFGLTSRELLSLATVRDEDGELMSRKPDIYALMGDEPMPGMGEPALIQRMRDVLVPALERVGADPIASIVRDVVTQSGWLARLEHEGSAGAVARAANLCKALALVDEITLDHPYSASAAHDAFVRRITEGKEAPGTLAGGNSQGAVRIMTIHASKGLEFPVAVVCGLDGKKASRSPAVVQCQGASHADIALQPSSSTSSYAQVYKRLKALDKIPLALLDEVGGVTAATRLMKLNDKSLDLDEVARLLYVGITRAREVAIVCLASKNLGEKPESSIIPSVLERLIGAPDDLGSVRSINVPGAAEGSFELICAAPFDYNGIHFDAAEPPEATGSDMPPESFEIVRPAQAFEPTACPTTCVRSTYSYSSIAHDKGEHAEDRGTLPLREDDEEYETITPLPRPDDPLAFGSAFHAAAQLMVEAGEDFALDQAPAIATQWGVDPAYHGLLLEALRRWKDSAVRAQARSWPCVRAEVPFVCDADQELDVDAEFCEGAIDLLCTDPDRADEALVIDYKTGGAVGEDAATLVARHALQARVYAHALGQAGYTRVTLKFVRVQIPDPKDACEPEVVSYVYENGTAVQ